MNTQVTELQAAMIHKIAFHEMNPSNGARPSAIEDVNLWADDAIETAQDKGVFTSLMNAGLVWHSGKGRDAGVGFTEAGWEMFQLLFPVSQITR